MNRLEKVQFRPVASILGLALFLSAAVTTFAQQQPDPNVRAARLSFVEGAVQLTMDGQILADPALVNAPLFQGTMITTKEDGRAEIQFDDGSVARVSPNSSLKITVLRQDGGQAKAELVLENGLAYFELQGDSSSTQTTARFGDSAVTASGFTVLRVSLDNLPGELAVFSGNAHLERGNSLSMDLHGGETVALNATDPNLYNLSETIEPDSWDAWNADRDQQLTSQEASKTVASGSAPDSNNPAWGDLDANGNWYNVPGQGYVWSPYAASSGSWDPYGCGNWMWTPQFGYIWVSCEQWGYLPYVSGNWSYYDGFGWGWAPGYGNPWWCNGGWGWNIANRPVRYQPPHRPHGGPVHPPNQPIRRGGFYQPNPVIAVNRIPSAPAANPVHVIGRPVTIGGTTIEPLRPISPRPIYNPSPASGFNGSTNSGNGYRVYGAPARPVTPGYGNTTRSGYVPWANTPSSAPSTWAAPTAPGGVYRPPVTGGGYHPAAPSGYSGGGSVSRPSGGGGAPHVSSGGGGGGGGHVSSGGGGGGGHAGSVAAPAGGGGHH